LPQSFGLRRRVCRAHSSATVAEKTVVAAQYSGKNFAIQLWKAVFRASNSNYYDLISEDRCEAFLRVSRVFCWTRPSA
jgi:hypothetical protein